MNILLIDDHFCAREGVALLLRQLRPNTQIFEAQTMEEGLAIADGMPLNLVLLDVQLPGKSGLEGVAELKGAFPGLCVEMFSGLEDSGLVFGALRLGRWASFPSSMAAVGDDRPLLALAAEWETAHPWPNKIPQIPRRPLDAPLGTMP